MNIIKLFKNIYQLHTKPEFLHREKFDKCKSCEYGVLVKPWRIHCIAGANCISSARKDKARKCQYKPKRLKAQEEK